MPRDSSRSKSRTFPIVKRSLCGTELGRTRQKMTRFIVDEISKICIKKPGVTFVWELKMK